MLEKPKQTDISRQFITYLNYLYGSPGQTKTDDDETIYKTYLIEQMGDLDFTDPKIIAQFTDWPDGPVFPFIFGLTFHLKGGKARTRYYILDAKTDKPEYADFAHRWSPISLERTGEACIATITPNGLKKLFANKPSLKNRILPLIADPIHGHVCDHCGRFYLCSSAKQKYCYPGCKARASNERRRERYIKRPISIKICPVCHGEYLGWGRTCGKAGCRKREYRKKMHSFSD